MQENKKTAKGHYTTKQGRHILDYLEDTKGKHFTVASACGYFREKNINVGTTTLYRQLERLVSEGRVKKYFIDENSSACFKYLGDAADEKNEPCYHLKCENCGVLIHLECREITGFERHILSHGFKIDPARTVFYGTCKECMG